MEEIWKTLKYHDQVYNRYEVSTFGNIRHKINKINRNFILIKRDIAELAYLMDMSIINEK